MSTPCTITPEQLARDVYAFFQAEGGWPLVRAMQGKYGKACNVRLLGAQAERRFLIVEEGSNGCCRLTLNGLERDERSAADLALLSRAIAQLASHYAARGEEKVSDAAFRDHLGLDALGLRKLNALLTLVPGIVTSCGSDRDGSYSIGAGPDAQHFEGIADFASFKVAKAKLDDDQRAIGQLMARRHREFARDLSGPSQAIAPPWFQEAGRGVQAALDDIDVLRATRGAASCVDRIQAAVLGYLRDVCKGSRIPVAANPSLTELWKNLSTQHPAFALQGKHVTHMTKVCRTISNLVDAFNPLRNQGSIAHASDDLLTEPQATLVLNCGYAIIQFVQEQLASSTAAE